VDDLKQHLKHYPNAPKDINKTLRRTLRISTWTKLVLKVESNQEIKVFLPDLVLFVVITSKDRPEVGVRRCGVRAPFEIRVRLMIHILYRMIRYSRCEGSIDHRQRVG
jgi:hypothetical protein